MFSSLQSLTNLEHLEEMIQQGESETVEFKKSTASLSSTGETLCGFLNGNGGTVVIGVSSDKKIIGQAVSDNTLREVADMIKRFEPPAEIKMEQIDLENGRALLILRACSRRSDVPYIFNGRSYQRIGSTTSQMPQSIYQRLLLERNHNNHRWETEIVDQYDIDDLDTEEIRRVVRAGEENGRLPAHQGETISAILDKFNLKKDGRLLNAAVVLFGKKILPNFAQCQLRLARFSGIDKAEFIDQNQLFGHAFELLEEAMMFLRRHLPMAGKIMPEFLERQEEPLFPLEALREALVNAFCHRTYTSPGGSVSVAIFDDRLEIWNDGVLPFGLTPTDLKKDHVSHQRNPLIANIFYIKGLIEKWGRGTQQIVSLCVKAGHPEPEFFEQAGSFVVRFLPSGYIAPHRISHGLSDRQRHILQSLSDSLSRGATFTKIKSRLLSPPADRTLRDDFQHLKRLGLIDVLGHGRGARWFLKKENKAE